MEAKRPRSSSRRAGVCALALGTLLASLLAGSAVGAPGDVTVAQVGDINPASGSSLPIYLTNVNGTLFFSAFDGTDTELWKATIEGPTPPAAPIATTQPTGQRAVALKKCKKKKSGKARAKCRKKANKLPV